MSKLEDAIIGLSVVVGTGQGLVVGYLIGIRAVLGDIREELRKMNRENNT